MSDPFQSPEVFDYARVPQPPASRGMATASMILGICSPFMALCPVVGIAVSVTGLVLGINAKKKNQGRTATAGIVLSCIGLVLALINGLIGAYLAVRGQHPLFNMTGATSSGG